MRADGAEAFFQAVVEAMTFSPRSDSSRRSELRLPPPQIRTRHQKPRDRDVRPREKSGFGYQAGSSRLILKPELHRLVDLMDGRPIFGLGNLSVHDETQIADDVILDRGYV
jgi:hypothetical protein